MLATEEKKLRWLGIDMRSRWRRRVAVAMTYAAFLLVVWGHTEWARVAVQGLWVGWILSMMWFLVAETEWPTRVVFTSLWALIMGVQMWGAWGAHGKAGDDAGIITVMYAAALMVFGSIMSWSGMAGQKGAGWMAQAIKEGDRLSARKQRQLARLGYAMGLEGIAWYEFTKKFKDLNPEERSEVEQLKRANPRGRWMRGTDRALLDDERLRQEENLLRAKVQRAMSWLLVLVAIVVYGAVANGWKPHTSVVVSGVWTLATLALTLRQAIVLWTEEDPIAVNGELELVEREA